MFATLCEYVSIQRDGTATLVRAGLEKIAVPTLPAAFGAVAYVDVRPNELQNGPHQVTLEVFSEQSPDDKSSIFKMQAGIQVTGSVLRMSLPFVAKMNLPGRYRVSIKVGNLSAELPIIVSVLPSSDGGSEK
jgi:hypothetical protein